MVADNIKFLRTYSGLNQTEFGRLFKRNRGNIDSYERSVAKPPMKTLIAIADHYGLTVEILNKENLRKNPGFLFKGASSIQMQNNKCTDLLKVKDEIIKEQRAIIEFLKKAS